MCHSRQILKQGANSAVRFTSYNTLRDAAISFNGGKQQQLGSVGTFIVGAAAGIVTVCESRDGDLFGMWPAEKETHLFALFASAQTQPCRSTT